MIKVAITGTGFMGMVHAEALKRTKGVQLVGIHGSSAEKSRKAAAQLDISKGYASYDELIADEEIDAVHITTPNRLHFEQASKALQAGKHVLCEKPLAMNAEESCALVKLAAESNCASGVNYNIRFYPLNQEAKAQARAGELGDIFSVFGSYVQDWLLFDTDYNWRVLAEEGGELRAVADIGTHWLDLVQNITGHEVTEVFADLHTVHPVRKRPKGEVQTFSSGKGGDQETEEISITTDDVAVIALRLDNGARGNLFVSQTTAGRKNCLRYEISGSRKAIEWNGERPNELWIGHRGEANQVLMKDPGLLSGHAAGYSDYPGGHNEGFPDTFKMCFRSFYKHIEAGDFKAASEFASFADGHREILVCEAILKSHAEQKWVKVG